MAHSLKMGLCHLKFFDVASALRKAGIKFEYHVFPHGVHGSALATKETAMAAGKEIEPQCEQWMQLCKNWLKYNF